MSTPTIVVVDDAVEVRTLVRARLRLSGALDVVGEGSSGHDAIALCARLRPTFLLLDVSMPGMDGLEALPVVRRTSPETRVVMYSGFAEEGLAERTMELGASAYFEKSTSLDTLAADLLALLDQPVVAADDLSRQHLPGDPGAVVVSEPVLREHLERFREVFEEATIGMATMTLSGRIVRANPQLSRLTGRSVGRLVAASWPELSGEDRARVQQALDKVAGGERDVAQVEQHVADDPERLLLTTLSAVRDAQGGPLYLFLQAQDLSAQREVEAELRLSEERFRLLVEAVQDYAIFMLDPQGHVASWNKGAERIKGWREDEIVGQHFRCFYPAHKQAERHPEHELEIAIREGHYEEEGWRVRKDGSTFWAHVTITAVRDGSGALVGFAKVTRDVTERLHLVEQQQRAAEALAEANAQLEAANRRLSRTAEDQAHFLAVTAHELRSPVGILGGSADLLRHKWRELKSGEHAELLEGMTLSAGRLRRLLDDLLAAARIDAGVPDLDLEVLDVRSRLTQVLRTAARALDVEVQLVDGPDVHAIGDGDRLAQMMENLLANAARHGAPPIMVDARRGSDGSGRDVVEIVVRDSGAGVPPHLQDKLFERYTTTGDGGTGLGLYIVRELARSQSGDARYDADNGAFVIELPAAAPAQMAEAHHA